MSIDLSGGYLTTTGKIGVGRIPLYGIDVLSTTSDRIINVAVTAAQPTGVYVSLTGTTTAQGMGYYVTHAASVTTGGTLNCYGFYAGLNGTTAGTAAGTITGMALYSTLTQNGSGGGNCYGLVANATGTGTLAANAFGINASAVTNAAATSTAYGAYLWAGNSSASACYGIYAFIGPSGKTPVSNPTTNRIAIYAVGPDPTSDSNNKCWAYYNNSSAAASGKMFMGADNIYTYWGTGIDCSIAYNGTNMLVTPDVVGTGFLQVYTAQALGLVIGKQSAGVDYQLEFFGETTQGYLTWMEDEGGFKIDSLLYGSMYGDDVSIAVTVAATSTEYVVGTGLSSGSVNGFTFATSTLTALVAGKYIVTWSMALQTTAANQILAGGIMINTTAQGQTEGSSEEITANRPVCVSGSGIITLAINDVVKLYVENDTATNDITVTHATLTLVRVGA